MGMYFLGEYRAPEAELERFKVDANSLSRRNWSLQQICSKIHDGTHRILFVATSFEISGCASSYGVTSPNILPMSPTCHGQATGHLKHNKTIHVTVPVP